MSRSEIRVSLKPGTRHVSGDALEEGVQLFTLLGQTRSELSDAEKLRVIAEAFGWSTDPVLLALLALFVAYRTDHPPERRQTP